MSSPVAKSQPVTGFGAKRDLARGREGGEEAKVEFIELFFDLVFVFAVTQISHFLLQHLSLLGAVQAAFLLLAVWWVWVFTAWVTNWMNPRRTAVKFLLFALMLAGLVLSSSLPDAFENRGLTFAVAYVFMQVGRSVFMVWALRHHNPDNFRNFLRITQWLALSGVFWIAGGLVEGEARFALWIAALAIEYVSPALRFWTPWNGASSTADWNIEGGHMAERSGLFIIIALGESVLVTGATFAEMEWSGAVIAAFLVSFLGTVAMWWLYFNIGAEKARHDIEHSDDPGRIARIAYTYLPVLLVAGIVVAAVADELVLAHPVGHHAELPAILVIVGGPALYVVGNMLFKRISFGRLPLSHMVGLALFAALAAIAPLLDPLPLGALATAILILVAVWENVSLRPGDG
jgi:low temperature requirement protein LtrA